jgi:P27 family predicted phage terminase small subunit
VHAVAAALMPRRPRPTALKLLHGERASRINDDELHFEPGAPERPEGLDEAVAATWDTLVAVLAPTGVLGAGDRFALWAMAQRWTDFERCSALVNTVGPLVVDEKRQPRRNPAALMQREAGRDVIAWCREFGLTPASRSQIRARLASGAPGGAPLDPVAARFLG